MQKSAISNLAVIDVTVIIMNCHFCDLGYVSLQNKNKCNVNNFKVNFNIVLV